MATLRKALVNDAVHSFCYSCRRVTHQDYWPVVIFNNTTPANSDGSYPAGLLTPFVAYAISQQPNYVIATRHIILLSVWLRSFNEEEQAYALTILEKYYVSPRSTISNQSDLSRYQQQGVSNSPELSEYD